MKMLKLIILLLGLTPFLTLHALADTLRIGSWNIQDFHRAENFSLRDFGDIKSVKRQPNDFAALAKYRNLFSRDGTPADVLALQEIGTKAALEKLFPADTYLTIMSRRWQTDDAPEGEGDVYTALAIRKDSGVTLIKENHLPLLAVLHTDGCPTRAGTGALLEFQGQQFWFLSVHLKSSCPTNINLHTTSDDDCETHWQQMPILADWIASKRQTGIPFIIAGDFNRRYRQMNFEDSGWEVLNGVQPDEPILEPWLMAHPTTATRKCPTRKGKGTQPIDWIMLDPKLNDAFISGSYWERRFTRDDVLQTQYGKGLSDHCPISIDLEF
jgi:endonuclease/exonuclease/phosphatase family metal-dependent hydrolase